MLGSAMIPPQERLATCARVVVMCLLAACSKGSNSAQSDAGPPPHINPCSVLTQPDIQNAFHVAPRAAGKDEDLGPTDDCTWNLPNGADVHVTFFNPVGAAVTYAPEVSPRTARDKTYEPVSGVGDHAIYHDDSSPVITVSESVEVVKGKQHFDVHYVDATPKAAAPSKSTMESLARTVLTHLP